MKKAIKATQKAIEIDPTNAEAYNNLGVLFYKLGEKSGALKQYQRAVELNPKSICYRKNLGDFYCCETGQKEKAIEIYMGILAEQPEDIDSRLGLARLCIENGQIGDAYFFYRQIKSLQPENDIANKMVVLLEATSPKSENVISIENENSHGYNCTANPHGKWEEDFRRHLKVLEKNPDHVETLMSIAALCFSHDRNEDALEFYFKVLKLNPKHKKACEGARVSLQAIRKGQIESFSYKRSCKVSGFPLVTAIVSVFNAERFLSGCLEDLEAQTIADKLEIIVVDSCSEQNEMLLVQKYQKYYHNIKYIRSNIRETVYGSWNRGIQAASGKYITNANSDDRHMPAALEILAKYLNENQDVALVYADCVITDKENETFEYCTPVGAYTWPEWNRHILLYNGCFMGPQPMWRRSVHDDYGYFDDSLVTSGDYEFWLRISQTNKFKHIPKFLGLYLRSPNSVEHANQARKMVENTKILETYRQASERKTIIKLIKNVNSDRKHQSPKYFTNEPIIDKTIWKPSAM